jgi:hypothetical protein
MAEAQEPTTVPVPVAALRAVQSESPGLQANRIFGSELGMGDLLEEILLKNGAKEERVKSKL